MTMCARCTRSLSSRNTSPDRLCGYCQKDLSPHHPGSKKYVEWQAAGRPRLDIPAKAPRKPARRGKVRLPCDPARLDAAHLLALLGACKVEVERRAGEARKLLATLEG